MGHLQLPVWMAADIFLSESQKIGGEISFEQ